MNIIDKFLLESQSLTGKYVALLLTEGVHDMETMGPLGYLTNRGANVITIGTQVGLVNTYNSSMKINVQQLIDDTPIDTLDALVIPGGKSPAKLREDKNVLDFVYRFSTTGKPIAAICHGPQILISAGIIIKGSKSSGFKDIKKEVEETGAEYVDKSVVKDGNIITSRDPDDIPDFCASIENELLK